MDSDPNLFLAYTIIFWLLSYLVIRKSKSPANVLFSSSTFLYGVGTLFSFIGWGPLANFQASYVVSGFNIIIYQKTFFAIAASFIVLAPLGIYFSGRTILHGNSGHRDELAVILIIVFLIIAFFNLLIYVPTPFRDNFMFEDALTALVLAISFIVYFNLYKQIPDYRTNFILILLGFTFGVVFLLVGLMLFAIGNDSLAEIMRSVGPFSAVFIILISFTNLPQAIRNRNL